MTTSAAKQVVETKQETAEAKKQQASMTVVKDEKMNEANRKLTLEERIHKVEDLSMLIDRLKNLHESRRKLQSFQVGADSLSSVVFLKDATGNEFKTSNSAVVGAVADEIRKTLDEKIAEVEQKIVF